MAAANADRRISKSSRTNLSTPFSGYNCRSGPLEFRVSRSGCLDSAVPSVEPLGGPRFQFALRKDFATEIKTWPDRGTKSLALQPGPLSTAGRYSLAFPNVKVQPKLLALQQQHPIAPRTLSVHDRPPIGATAIPQAAVLALQGLRDHRRLETGQKVLINGAGGGGGTFAVQIAKAGGAEVTGVDLPANWTGCVLWVRTMSWIIPNRIIPGPGCVMT